MENSTVSGLRSRSRSKTPFLRSSCDRESCGEGGDHTHQKSGRKTPLLRSTPVKQLLNPTSKPSTEPILEEDEPTSSQRTRQSSRLSKVKTSDYSSEESLEGRKEVVQNEINSRYERISTTRRYGTLEDVSLSPIHVTSLNVTADRSTRFGSPAYSACSTDSSFAEQALADTSLLLDREPTVEHLPYRLYKMAGEYWNKYPKTDYTYSPLSKDRVELAPGQIAVPNMSRRSLAQFRTQQPNTSRDELDTLTASKAWTDRARKRLSNIDSSDDESYYRGNGRITTNQQQQWWLMSIITTIITTITTTITNITNSVRDGVASGYRSIVGPSHRYPYTDRRPQEAGVLSRTASLVAAPFYWLYMLIKTVVTTTVTTITETVSPTVVPETRKRVKQTYQENVVESKRRRWPWLLLLLLPAVVYGCCTYEQWLPQETIKDTYSPPVIAPDSALNERVAALENWALNVDTKLKTFDQKLSKFDNLEAQIEQYSLKHLQNNLIQVFNLNDNDAMTLKLKEYFDQHYMSKDDMQKLSQEVHERLINSWKPEIDQDRIRQIVQEYLSVYEKEQLTVIIERVKEYVKEVEVRHEYSGFDVEAVKKIVAGMLDVYDADKTGLVDFALESAGGQVLSTRCTELYQIKTKQYSILGLPVWWVYTSPRFALSPGAMPAECWAFQGFPGYLVIRTYAIIEVTGFSVEHMSRLLAVEGKIESAPKNFSVYGLHDELDPEPHLFGNYMYNANGTAIQYFPVQYPKTSNIGGTEYPVAYDIVELRVQSNYGNPTYTCVYRFRVHGNPLNDIRRATEDSIRDSEAKNTL